MKIVEIIRHSAVAFFFVTMSICLAFGTAVALREGAELPELPKTVKVEEPRCSMWTTGILTCNIYNPANEPANVAVTVSAKCKGKNADDIYQETIIAEHVPEQGWSAVVVNSEGYTLFYKNVENRLKKHAEHITRLAVEGGLTRKDLTPAQISQLDRTVFDVCKLDVGIPRLTLTSPHRNVDFMAALKTLWAK